MKDENSRKRIDSVRNDLGFPCHFPMRPNVDQQLRDLQDHLGLEYRNLKSPILAKKKKKP